MDLRAHAGTICSGLAVLGVGLTAYLSGKAALKAKETPVPEGRKEKIKRFVKVYGPAVASGVATSALIISGDRIHVKKELALGGAVAMWKSGFLELDKATEEAVGKEKAEEIRSSIKERLSSENTDISKLANAIKIYEPYTGQYIWTTRETIAWVMLEANRHLQKEWECPLNVIVKGLGGKVTEEGDLYRWSGDSESQIDTWNFFNMGPWIDFQLIPKQHGAEMVLELEYPVPPERPYYEDKLYREATN